MTSSSSFLFAASLALVACGASTPPATDAPVSTSTPAPAPSASPSSAPSAAATADAEASAPASDEDGDCKGQACIKRCDAKPRPRDCEEAGMALREGNDDVKADEKRAATYLQKACDLKAREGCYRLADLLTTSEAVPHDEAKAVKLLGLACDLGRGDACDQLSRRAESGTGLPKDHKKAIALLIQGCIAEDYQVWTCNRLRETAEKKDAAAAKALADWKKACDAKKDKTACEGVERTTKKK